MSNYRLVEFRRFAEGWLDVDPGTFLSRGRPAHIAHPRQIAMAAAREMSPQPPLTAVRDAFNMRCHGTVMFAARKVDKDPELRATRDRLLEAWRLETRKPSASEQPATATTG